MTNIFDFLLKYGPHILVIVMTGVVIYKNICYKKIILSCGTFRIKCAYASDVEILMRIVSKEFFNGGNVDDQIVKEVYERYGPVSWTSIPDMIFRYRYKCPVIFKPLLMQIWKVSKRFFKRY